MRACDFGVVVGSGMPGRWNAITDVAGVRVGHRTLIDGEGPLRVGDGPVRTGVTVIQPGATRPWERPVFAGFHRLNGAGEMTGVQWIAESGRMLNDTNGFHVRAEHVLVAAETMVGRDGITAHALGGERLSKIVNGSGDSPWN